MTRDDAQWDEVISAYRRHYELSTGDRRARLSAEQTRWAYEAVDDAIRDGSLPLSVVDALVCDPDGSSEYRAYVAAGPVEDLLTSDADTYGSAFAQRARLHDHWAEALRGVWLSSTDWAALPEDLRRFIPEPVTSEPDADQQRRSGRRPSKRQSEARRAQSSSSWRRPSP